MDTQYPPCACIEMRQSPCRSPVLTGWNDATPPLGMRSVSPHDLESLSERASASPSPMHLSNTPTPPCKSPSPRPAWSSGPIVPISSSYVVNWRRLTEPLRQLTRHNDPPLVSQEHLARELYHKALEHQQALLDNNIMTCLQIYDHISFCLKACRLTLAPMRKLPVEVLQICLELYTDMTLLVRPSGELGRVRSALIPLWPYGPYLPLYVCTKWRNICLSSPRICAHYMYDLMGIIGVPWKYQGQMLNARLRYFLRLYPSSPLYMRIVAEDGRGPSAFAEDPRLFAYCAQRCTELALTGASLAAAMRNLAPIHGRLYRLDTLEISCDLDDPELDRQLTHDCPLFVDAPKLRELRLFKKSVAVPLPLPWEQIEDFQCHYDQPTECLTALGRLSCVKTVRLHRIPNGTYVRPRPEEKQDLRLPYMISLDAFHKFPDTNKEETCFDMRHYPSAILDSLSAPALEHLRISLRGQKKGPLPEWRPQDHLAKGAGVLRFGSARQPDVSISVVTSFLLRSECRLVSLFLAMHNQETDEELLELFRMVPALSSLTFCMCGVAKLSPSVLNALTIWPCHRNLLPHLQHLTLITDASPQMELEFESNPLADFIESRVNARQIMTKAEAGGGGQLVENLKIFRLACQEDHLFCWCKKMRKRRARWLKQGLKMAMAVVDMPTQFIDLTDHGEFTGDWEWLV